MYCIIKICIKLFHLVLLLSLVFIESPIQISAPFSLFTFATLLVIVTAVILYTFFKSTLHQGSDSFLVRVQDPLLNLRSLFPSTAPPAPPKTWPCEDWMAFRFSATFLRRIPYWQTKLLLDKKTIECIEKKNSLPSSAPDVSMREIPVKWLDIEIISSNHCWETSEILKYYDIKTIFIKDFDSISVKILKRNKNNNLELFIVYNTVTYHKGSRQTNSFSWLLGRFQSQGHSNLNKNNIWRLRNSNYCVGFLTDCLSNLLDHLFC